ncbi:MAG: YebC/PmpR family DNA-binding transcriptional regulator [Deltaproteobacteria bacterium]|nr:YebC/PmpR family DNA-binding transcriptional regulator [Deltaproteobacteria bacterium]
MSGHSKWATIKHKKAATDAKRGRSWTKALKEVTIASRHGGDPSGNPRLRKAVDGCRALNVPAENITRAIKRGTGELEGVSYEELVYEGVGPAGVLVLIDVVTDNRNRTAAELRKIFEKAGGTMSGGSALWGFDRKGQVRLERSAATEEQLFEIALGAGGEDIADEGEEWVITSSAEDVEGVREALEAAKIQVKSSGLAMIPKNVMTLGPDDAPVVLRLVDTLDDHDDVQSVWSAFDLSDEALASLEE